jgi:ankyrin repeat protein
MRPLIEAGADVKMVDKDGAAPLHKAIFMENSEAMRVLVKAGADVNLAEKGERWTPLDRAAGHDRVEAVRVLVDAGADVKCADEHGWTSLHLAAYKGHVGDGGTGN